jgi:hypothetical protein
VNNIKLLFAPYIYNNNIIIIIITIIIIIICIQHLKAIINLDHQTMNNALDELMTSQLQQIHIDCTHN